MFGDRHGAYMHRFARTHIVRRLVVKSAASPDHPALADYWAWRGRKPILPIYNTTLRVLQSLNGCCAICKSTLRTVLVPTPIASSRETRPIRPVNRALKKQHGAQRYRPADCR